MVEKTFPVERKAGDLYSENYFTAKDHCTQSFKKQHELIIKSNSSYEKIKGQIDAKVILRNTETAMINNFVFLTSLAKNEVIKSHDRIDYDDELVTKYDALIENAVKELEKKNLLSKSLDEINKIQASGTIVSGTFKLAIINKIVEKSTLSENLKAEMMQNPNDIACKS